MIRYFLLLAAIAIGLHAKEISNEKLHFKISFPDDPDWSLVDHQAQGSEVNLWSAENQKAALVLNFQVVDAPMPEAKPTFKENAEEWEKGMMTRFSRKISSRFARIADHEAYELVASLKAGDVELFFSNWMIQVGEITYGITIITKESSKLSGNTATAFIESLAISK